MKSKMSDNIEQSTQQEVTHDSHIENVAGVSPEQVIEKTDREVQFDLLLTTLSSFKTQVTSLQHQIKILEKTVNKEIKSLRKASTKKSKANRKPSGFAKSSKISSELCAFMGLADGSEVARTDVTRHLISYIKSNNLQDASNRKRILLDVGLQSLLDVPAGVDLTYFNLQRYMNRHFVRSVAVPVPVV
jgi:chromatin remodeling complex protein RSC6